MTRSIGRFVALAAVGILWMATTPIVVAQVESAQVRIDGMT